MNKKRSLYKLISHLIMLMLVLTMATGSTFSWYNRNQGEGQTGKLLSYAQTGKVNNAFSKSRTVQTYAGTNNNGQIVYSDTAVSGTVNVPAGEVCYFKTVIQDNAGVGDSIVSLYIKSITVSQSISNTIYIGLVGYEKTYEQFRSSNYVYNNLCIEDNIYLVNNGTVEVCWFIKSGENFNSDGTVTLDTQYLVYN